MNERRSLVALTVLALIVSVIRPYDLTTWFLEVFPVLIALPILIATHRRFPLTPISYRLLCFFGFILIAGGHWTYARVPVGDWVRDALHLQRNPFDRFGHVFQGVIPAMVIREMLLRQTPLRRGRWLNILCVCVALAISASYELFEWGDAVIQGDGSVDFLGSQGDVWDAQWDMFCALTGAIISLIVLSRAQDRQLSAIPEMGRDHV